MEMRLEKSRIDLILSHQRQVENVPFVLMHQYLNRNENFQISKLI
jgi:hypothetical protein